MCEDFKRWLKSQSLSLAVSYRATAEAVTIPYAVQGRRLDPSDLEVGITSHFIILESGTTQRRCVLHCDLHTNLRHVNVHMY